MEGDREGRDMVMEPVLDGAPVPSNQCVTH
jgi:hypothetical protein